MDLSQIKDSELVRDFQKDSVKWLEEKNGNGLLALDMGVGKTLVSLIYTTSLNFKTLVVCPNAVKYVWKNEIKKWTNRSYKVLSSKDKDWNLSSDYTIINYDIVFKFFNLVPWGRYKRWILKDKLQPIVKNIDCIIVDESHYIKSYKARRSKAVKHLKIPHRILLTGTPITNKPMDLFNQLNYLDPEIWSDFYGYRDRYTQGYIHPTQNFYIETGSRNTEELSQRIKPYVFRKRKEEVLSELPERIYNILITDLQKENKIKYKKAVEDFEEFLKEFTDLEPKEIDRRLRAEALTRVQSLKQICSNSKTQGKKSIVKETVENILDNNPKDKIVIFSQYRKVVKDLKNTFPNSVIIHGEIDPKERAERIKEFQENPEIKIFIGTTQVSGVGITLTSASNILFCDLLWNPADAQQCVDRLHRIGQVKPVNVFYLLARNTIDESIYALLEKKQGDIDTIIDGGKFKRSANVFNLFLKQQLKKVQNL